MSSENCSRAMRGWLAGCGAATGVISTFVLVVMAIASSGDWMLFAARGLPFLLPMLLIFVVTCLLTAIPAVLVVRLSEKFGMHSILFFGCAGAVTGALSEAVLLGAMFRRGPPQVTWLFVVAGFVAGVVYWRIAGRHAGRDREAPGHSA